MTKIAVYGTLKRGFNNHHVIERAKYLGTCRTPPIFTMYDLGSFPAVVPNGNTAVLIEVYEVTPAIFKRADWLEGYPTFYNRTLIDTDFGKAWIYYMDGVDNCIEIDSGVWGKQE